MSARRRTVFKLEESRDTDGITRLALRGELDLANLDLVNDRFQALAQSRQPARIDLSALDFIDSSGIRAVVLAVEDAKGEGRAVEVERSLAPQVEHVISVLGVDALLWPGSEPSSC